MSILFYVLAIILANVVTAAIHPIPVGVFLVPAGTFLIGATLLLRNWVQIRYGRGYTYWAILIALVASGVTSHLLGDSLAVMVASAISFAISEVADTETYTRLALPIVWRVWWGGAVGGILDSTIFVTIGLSPIGAGFLTWGKVPYAILGQLIVKVAMQGIGAYFLSRRLESYRTRGTHRTGVSS